MRTNLKRLVGMVLLMVLTFFVANSSFAEYMIWSGADPTTNLWSSAANWVGGVRPNFNDIASFTNDASSTQQPDTYGANNTGMGLDFQTSGWTLYNTGVGAYIRVDAGLLINSLGSGVNRVYQKITTSGSVGDIPVTVDANSTIVFLGGYYLFGDRVVYKGGGTIVWDGPDDTYVAYNPCVLSNDLSIIINSEIGIGWFRVTEGTIGGNGIARGYNYATSEIGGNATLSPGGNGEFGDLIGTFTMKANSATVRHHLILKTGCTLKIEFDSVGNSDKLLYSGYGGGKVTIESGCTLSMYGGEFIDDGTYDVVANEATDMTNISGTFSTVTFNDAALDAEHFTVDYGTDAITVTVTGLGKPKGTVVFIQ